MDYEAFKEYLTDHRISVNDIRYAETYNELINDIMKKMYLLADFEIQIAGGVKLKTIGEILERLLLLKRD